MHSLYNFFLSDVLNVRIYDEYNQYIGKLYDMYVITEDIYPKIIGYKVKKGREISNYEFKKIDFMKNDGKIEIKVKGARDIIPTTYSYLLSKHLLDKKIIDVDGKKLVRVKDIRLIQRVGEIRVIAVEASDNIISKRLGMSKVLKVIYKIINKKEDNQLIMWDNVESIELVNSNSRLKLTVPYKKLSKLHPADLADLLEDMDTRERNRVFESLDSDFAAETLEEIETDIQVDILENLSQLKTAVVLDNMPNDEIANILNEADEETAEKILINMNKEDAEEIRTLMKYEEETVGSLMNKDFISFNVNITVEETLDILKETNPDEEVVYYIYITDENKTLQGVISFKELVFAKSDTKLKDIMEKDVMGVKDNDNVEEVIDIAVKYNLFAVPVMNVEKKLCGVVVMNDIIDEVLLPAWKKKLKRVS